MGSRKSEGYRSLSATRQFILKNKSDGSSNFLDDGTISRRSSSQNLSELKGGNHSTLETLLNSIPDQPLESNSKEEEIQTEVCIPEVAEIEQSQALADNRLTSPSPIKEFLECELPENELNLPAPLLVESTPEPILFPLDQTIPEVSSFHRYIYDQTNTLYPYFFVVNSHLSAIQSLAFNQSSLMSCDRKGTVCIWELNQLCVMTIRLIDRLKYNEQPSQVIYSGIDTLSATWIPCMNAVALGDVNGAITLYSVMPSQGYTMYQSGEFFTQEGNGLFDSAMKDPYESADVFDVVYQCMQIIRMLCGVYSTERMILCCSPLLLRDPFSAMIS